MSAIAERLYQQVQQLPLQEQQEILDFADFISQKVALHQQKAMNCKRPTHAHPVLSNIGLNYDPTEPLSDDEWGEDVR